MNQFLYTVQQIFLSYHLSDLYYATQILLCVECRHSKIIMGSNYKGNYLFICVTVGLAFYTWTVIILKMNRISILTLDTVDIKSAMSNNFPFLARCASNTSEMKNKEIRFRGKKRKCTLNWLHKCADPLIKRCDCAQD